MKKLFSVLVVGLLLIAFACGGGGKYAEAKKVMQGIVDTTENFVADVEKAGSADDVASAINTFADEMKKFKTKMEELQEKYPELKDQTEVPEDIKSLTEKLAGMQAKMMGAMTKAQQYMTDPKVQEALKKLADLK